MTLLKQVIDCLTSYMYQLISCIKMHGCILLLCGDRFLLNCTDYCNLVFSVFLFLIHNPFHYKITRELSSGK